MGTKAGSFLIFTASVLLSSCSAPDIEIAVERLGGRVRLTLSQDWGFIFRDERIPCVREIGLHAPDSNDRHEAAWLIEAKGDVQCLDLATVDIGKVPDGWREVVPLSAVHGRTYFVTVLGIGWGEAGIKF